MKATTVLVFLLGLCLVVQGAPKYPVGPGNPPGYPNPPSPWLPIYPTVGPYGPYDEPDQTGIAGAPGSNDFSKTLVCFIASKTAEDYSSIILLPTIRFYNPPPKPSPQPTSHSSNILLPNLPLIILLIFFPLFFSLFSPSLP